MNYLGLAKQASDDESTAKFLVNHIKKIHDYANEVGNALESLEISDTLMRKPQMKSSTDQNATIK